MPVHEYAYIYSATSEATGTAKENLLDQNLDTIWTPTTTDTQYIIIDLGSARPLSAIGLWIANYLTDFSATHVSVEGKVDSNFASGATLILDSVSLTHLLNPLWFYDFAETNTFRYFRITLASLPAVIDLAHIFLLNKHALTYSYNKDASSKNKRYSNNRVTLNGNKQYISTADKSYVYVLHRTYDAIGTTFMTMMQTIFDNSFGGRQLIILQEGDAVSDALVCRIMHDEPQVTIMDYNYEQHVLDMESLAYIKDGEVF